MRLPGTILQGILACAALTFLRIYLGVVFVLSAWPEIEPLPNAMPATDLIPWAELLVGSMLILGGLTRLSAAAALLLSINSLLEQNASRWMPSTSAAAYAAIAVALIVGAAGRTFGLDSFLASRWPRSPFW